MIKIAFPTDDGETISAHLGRAQAYVVATLDAAEAPRFEQRAKPHHGNHEHSHAAEAGHEHGQGMFEALADCQVLIAGGMGQPAFDKAVARGLKVLLTGEKTIRAALEAYRNGMLISDLSRVHAHGHD